TGDNLDTAMSVQFNGISASFQVFGTSLFATVPTLATSGPISVVTPKGSAVSSSVFTVESPLAPEISDFSPNTGAAGTPVTVAGTNLAGATGATFGGILANFVSVSATQMMTFVPTGAITSPITVTTPFGTTVSSNSFVVTPWVQSFAPSFGTAG